MTKKTCEHETDEQNEDGQKKEGDACDVAPERLGVSPNHHPAGRIEHAADSNDEEGYDDADYTPDFVRDALRIPPILPGESSSIFEALFESFEMNYANPHRPKTDVEFFWTLQATKAAFELLRYDRMKACAVLCQQRHAVQSLHRQTSPTEPANRNDRYEAQKFAREGSIRFFADPSYRATFAEMLERHGFGSNAVEGTAFLLALPSLVEIDRLIRSSEKRLADCLKRLDAAYALRDPEDPMPAKLRRDGQ